MAIHVKICGLKTPEAVLAALDGGASHVGFIFFPKSPRNIAPADAAELRRLAKGRAKTVAVTVDADDPALDAIVSALGPDLLQLHGHETPERLRAVRARYGLPVIKALPVREAADLTEAARFEGAADHLLFDAKPPADALLPGGNGVSFDWTLLEAAPPAMPYFLSGGLRLDNVEEALRLAQPAGLDISSGVESAPGVKDASLIRAFLARVHNPSRSLELSP